MNGSEQHQAITVAIERDTQRRSFYKVTGTLTDTDAVTGARAVIGTATAYMFRQEPADPDTAYGALDEDAGLYRFSACIKGVSGGMFSFEGDVGFRRGRYFAMRPLLVLHVELDPGFRGYGLAEKLLARMGSACGCDAVVLHARPARLRDHFGRMGLQVIQETDGGQGFFMAGEVRERSADVW